MSILAKTRLSKSAAFMVKKLVGTFWTEKENLQLALEEIKTLTSKESVIEDIFEGIGSGELERIKY